MNAQEFVDLIKLVVRDDAVSGTLSVLQRPPGRRPSSELRKNSDWYRSLNEEQRERLVSIIEGAVDQAVFGFLCVIDGARAIEDGKAKGRLELRHIRGRTSILNPSDGPMLHDLY